MANDGLELYRRWLACGLEQSKCHDKKFVQESFAETIQLSPAYHEDAFVNGKAQPIVATRKDTKKCDITVVPGGNLCIGDLVKVFNEFWICVELYVDEYGMRYGELWMCNQVFCYQDFNLNTICKHAVLDDGSYSKDNDKAIAVADNSFNCYISLDEESQALYIDKRLGIGVVYDSSGKEVLEVGKIKWIDIKSKNFGEGSHLMMFGINDDPFNPETDNIKELICDYHEANNNLPGESSSPSETCNEALKGVLHIDGRGTIKAGTGRTYTLCAIENETRETIVPSCEIEWKVECDVAGVLIVPNGSTCKVLVQEDDDLIGTSFILRCVCRTGEYEDGKIMVEVT